VRLSIDYNDISYTEEDAEGYLGEVAALMRAFPE
jgi:hypothetical protein